MAAFRDPNTGRFISRDVAERRGLVSESGTPRDPNTGRFISRSVAREKGILQPLTSEEKARAEATLKGEAYWTTERKVQRYWDYVRSYAAKNGMSVSEARQSEEFKQAFQRIKQHRGKETEAEVRDRIEALVEVGWITEAQADQYL